MNNIRVKIKEGEVTFGEFSCFCFCGKNGGTENKIEGDMKTPLGVYPIRRIFYRKDRVEISHQSIKCIPIEKDMGWCDDVEDSYYNRLIKLPSDSRHEKMWRDDSAYDVVIEIGYNDDPVIKGKGSAIFVHCTRPDMKYTEGCIALNYNDIVRLVDYLNMGSLVKIDQ